MASSLGVLLILLGGFAMAVGYSFLSDCSKVNRNGNCWDPGEPGAFSFYLGAIFAVLGTVMLAGGKITGFMRKLREGSDGHGL